MSEQSAEFTTATLRKIKSYLKHSSSSLTPELKDLLLDMHKCHTLFEAQSAELNNLKNLHNEEIAYYKSIFENQPAGLFKIRTFKAKQTSGSVNPPFEIEFVTDRFCKLLEISRKEFNQNPFVVSKLVHPDDKKSFETTFAHAQKKHKNFQWIGRLILKTRTIWVRFESLPSLLPTGDVIWTGVMADITKQKEIEQAYQNSKLQLEDVIEGANIGTLEWNVQTGKVKFNKIWAKNLGYSLLEIKLGTLFMGKKGWKAITHPDDIDYAEKMLQRHFSGELSHHNVEVRMRHKKGHWVWIRQEGRVKSWTPDGKPLLMYGVHTNISAQKEAELALSKLNSELEKRIAERTSELTQLNASLIESENKLIGITMEVEERERNRFSSELHDGMGPLLSTIKLYFQWLSETTDPVKRKLITEKGNSNIELAINTSRELARGLSSQYLHEVGFVSAVNEFIQQLNYTNKIAISFESTTDVRMSELAELMLYRITTELIKNTITYAQASSVEIIFRLSADDKTIELIYSDNGIGFDPENQKQQKTGFGLISIRQRVEVLKGKLEIQSTPGHGMTATIQVPIENIR